MLSEKHIAGMMRLRSTADDVARASSASTPAAARSDRSRKFAVMGAAILERLCSEYALDVVSRATTTYIINTCGKKVAVSVMVSTTLGDPGTKHMVVPSTSLRKPRGADSHVIVCAFVSKFERIRERNGGVESTIAGWLPASDVAANSAGSRVHSMIRVFTVPVSRLRPISDIIEYVCNK